MSLENGSLSIFVVMCTRQIPVHICGVHLDKSGGHDLNTLNALMLRLEHGAETTFEGCTPLIPIQS